MSTSNANVRSNPNATCESRDQEAILQLDATTLTVKSAWEVPVSQQASDSDFGASPMLFNATIGGTTRQLVGAENKNGVYYVLDRDNLAAGPVWAYVAENAAALARTRPARISTPSRRPPGRDSVRPSWWRASGLNGSSCIGTLAALNPATGQPEWQVSLQGEVDGAVTEVPGLVAVGAGSISMCCRVPQARRSFPTPSRDPAREQSPLRRSHRLVWAPPTIAGNALYASNQDGNLRCLSR